MQDIGDNRFNLSTIGFEMTRIRRIAKHITERDWSTLSIEMLVLVVGVFLGIQAVNWDDARRDRDDEANFLKQLRVDVASAEALSNQIGQYRVEHRAHLRSALDVLFGRSDRNTLTALECQAIHTSAYINMPFVDIGSFDELSSSGRIGIIRDKALLAALLRLQQAIVQSNRTVDQLSIHAFSLAADFPELIVLDAEVDNSRGRAEIRTVASCDTNGMRDSQRFLDMAGSNMDLNDAFFRDGFEPWQKAINDVRARIDVAAGVSERR